MKALRLPLLLLTAVALVAIPACGGGSKPKLAFVSNNNDEFWNYARAGAMKAGHEETEYDVAFEMPDKGDAAVQKEKINTLLNQNLKGIAISVIDAKNQGKDLDDIAGKVNLITVDNDAPKTKRKVYIGTDNYEAGRAAGVLVKRAMPEGGIIVIFVGQFEAVNAQERRQGVLDELAGEKNVTPKEGAKYGNYTLYKWYTDQPEGHAKAKENALAAIRDLNKEEHVCFIGLWAYNPPQMLSAVKDKEKLGKIKMVGFDENQATLEGVRDGHIYGTVVQQPFEFGYQSIKLLAALSRGDESKIPKDGIVHIPHVVVTKTGEAVDTLDLKDGDGKHPGKKAEVMEVEAFRKKLNEILGK
jgi:ribose transport system substrate-binding protein